MRRLLPILIVVIGLAALFVDFWPNLHIVQLGNIEAGPAKIETKLGLDLQGGLEIIYQAQPKDGKTPTGDQMNVIRQIIENRVNSTGVAEPIIEVVGNNEIDVQLPGATNADQIRKLVGTTGLLQFVDLPAATYGTQGTAGTTPVPGKDQVLPADVVAQHTILTGASLDVGKVTYGFNQTDGPVVNFGFNDQAAQTFATYTTNNVNHFFAIVLDGKVVSAPYIKSAITGGTGTISGSFTVQSAKDLVTILQYGALPFPIAEAGIPQNIPATLGKSFLNQTLLAGGIGILLVLLFMLIYYRLPGVVADLALIYYALVVLALFRMVPVTLTLAGVAGFVLSIGMAVDANILIFERTKEELRVGKTLPAAIEAGFNRAWNSILDSNVSSLITASILYFFGTSTIKGFALVLIIGVLTSMFTAVTVSRTLLRLVVQQQSARRAWLYGVTDEEFQARSATGRPARREARVRV